MRDTRDSFDNALTDARNFVVSQDSAAQSRRRFVDELNEQITQVLIEAAERFRGLPASLWLVVARPAKRFERTDRQIEANGARYVVLSEQRCWALPPSGSRGSGSHSLMFTEQGGLVWADRQSGSHPIAGGARIPTPDPTVFAYLDYPRAADAAAEFEKPSRYEDDPREPILRSLRNTLAQSYVAFERAIGDGANLEDLFWKWPIEWRRS